MPEVLPRAHHPQDLKALSLEELQQLIALPPSLDPVLRIGKAEGLEKERILADCDLDAPGIAKTVRGLVPSRPKKTPRALLAAHRSEVR